MSFWKKKNSLDQNMSSVSTLDMKASGLDGNHADIAGIGPAASLDKVAPTEPSYIDGDADARPSPSKTNLSMITLGEITLSS